MYGWIFCIIIIIVVVVVVVVVIIIIIIIIMYVLVECPFYVVMPGVNIEIFL